MKFGLHFLHQKPASNCVSDSEMFANSLAQAEFADKLGFDYIWTNEHHFLGEYGRNSGSEIWLAAASQRVRSARLGLGVQLISPTVVHPIKAAGKIATLDCISNGRLDWGVGMGASRCEMLAFGIDPITKVDVWKTTVKEIANLLAMDTYPGAQTSYFSIDANQKLVPKPVQQPHPPIWASVVNLNQLENLGKLGIGVLAAILNTDKFSEELSTYVKIYKDAITRASPIGHSVNNNFSLLSYLKISNDLEILDRYYHRDFCFNDQLLNMVFSSDAKTVVEELQFSYKETTGDLDKQNIDLSGFTPTQIKDQLEWMKSSRGTLLGVGTVQMVLENIKKAQDAGVDQMLFVAHCGHQSHDEVMETLEIFGTNILPHFKN